MWTIWVAAWKTGFGNGAVSLHRTVLSARVARQIETSDLSSAIYSATLLWFWDTTRVVFYHTLFRTRTHQIRTVFGFWSLDWWCGWSIALAIHAEHTGIAGWTTCLSASWRHHIVGSWRRALTKICFWTTTTHVDFYVGVYKIFFLFFFIFSYN